MPRKPRPRSYGQRLNGEDMARLTVYVPAGPLAEFRRNAKKNRVSLSQLASEAIDQHLERLQGDAVAIG